MLKNFISFASQAIKICDFFGHPVPLLFDSKPLVKSKLSAFISMVIIAVVLYIFIINVSTRTYIQTISSTMNYDVLNDIAKGKYNGNETYIFDHQNYYMMFSLAVTLPNGTILWHQELEKYFTQKLAYVDYFNNLWPVEYDLCLNRKIKEFLGQDFDPNDNSTYLNVICVKNETLPMGFLNIPSNQIGYMNTVIYYDVVKCQNSTVNNFSCASNDEIAQIMPYVSVSIGTPNTVYDFNKNSNPKGRNYDYNYYHLDSILYKRAGYQLTPVKLFSDYGLLTEDYVLEDVDFNLIKITDYVQTFPSAHIQNSLFEVTINFGLQEQQYHRVSNKLLNILASLGGTINILLILGNLFGYTYNRLIFQHQIINVSFRNLETNPKESKYFLIFISFIK